MDEQDMWLQQAATESAGNELSEEARQALSALISAASGSSDPAVAMAYGRFTALTRAAAQLGWVPQTRSEKIIEEKADEDVEEEKLDFFRSDDLDILKRIGL